MVKKDKNLKYLIRLLDDEDNEVYQIVRAEIKKYGEDVLQDLKKSREKTVDIFLYKRIDSLINEIIFEVNKSKFLEWLDRKERNIIEGLILLDKMYSDSVSEKEIYDFLDKIVRDIWLELNNNLTPLEKINIVNHFLFKVYNFKIEKKVKENNHFIHRGLFHKNLNEYSVALIYYYLCERLNIDLLPIIYEQEAFLGYKIDKSTNQLAFIISPKRKGKILPAYLQFDRDGGIDFLIKYWLVATVVMFNKKNNNEMAKNYLSLLKKLNNAGV